MRFHVSKDQTVNECEATVKTCPLEHFESREDAERELEARYSSGVSKRPTARVELDAPTSKAVSVLSEVGQPYVVGGAVRDSYFGAQNKDVDVEVHDADLDTIVARLKSRGYAVDEVGKSFGVLKVTGNGVRDLDVSVPRRENRVGAGHRDFEVDLSKMTPREAAERRDFTLNAIMYDPVTKQTVDPTGGEKDLRSGTLRHVSEKFSEDPLRVMRGFQMAGRFNMRYAPETADECRRIRGEYSSLSDERIREEWDKFYTKSSHPAAGVKALQDSGWDDTEPGLRESLSSPETTAALKRLPSAPKSERSAIGLAVVSRSMSDDDGTRFRSKISMNKSDQRESGLLVNAESADLSTPQARRWFAKKNSSFSFKRFENYSRVVGSAQGLKAARQAKRDGVYEGPERDLVRGDEVAEAVGRKPGRWMGDALDELRDLQYSRKVTSREGLLDEARRRFK